MLTPEAAQRLFNFKMRPGEKYVVFKKLHGHNIICHHNNPGNPKTTLQIKYRTIFAKLQSLAHQLGELKELWQTREWSYNANFVGENQSRVSARGDWRELKLTFGPLPPPRILVARYCFTVKKLIIGIRKPADMKIGIALLDPEKAVLKVIPAARYKNPRKIIIPKPKEIYKPVLYLYYRQGTEYSDSTSIIPQRIRKWLNKYPFKNG